MEKKIFDVSEEMKTKRVWVMFVLTSLLIVSFITLSIGYPFSNEVALAFVISFAVAFILKIIDWVEGSKLAEQKIRAIF